MSLCNLASIFGRRILTATLRRSPSSSMTALWTWAIEAAAIGSLNSVKSSSTDLPSSSLMVFLAIAIEKGGILSRSMERSLALSGPMRSSRVARNWPSFMYVGPRVDKALAMRCFLAPWLANIRRGAESARKSLMGAGKVGSFGKSLTPCLANTKPALVRRNIFRSALAIFKNSIFSTQSALLRYHRSGCGI